MAAVRAWRSGLVLALCAYCSAGATLPVRIEVVVYDGAALGKRTLSSAEKITEEILLVSGLATQWSVGPTSELNRLGIDFSAQTSGACVGQLPGLLKVLILARAPAGFSTEALGFSLPCATTGIQVILYVDRIAQVRARTAPTFQRVLGYAMVHELGHVLLRSARHGDSGLMKAVWSASDWQRSAVSIMPFSPEQSRRMIGTIQDSRRTAIAPTSILSPR